MYKSYESTSFLKFAWRKTADRCVQSRSEWTVEHPEYGCME